MTTQELRKIASEMGRPAIIEALLHKFDFTNFLQKMISFITMVDCYEPNNGEEI